MDQELVKIGLHVVNLSAIAGIHWERETLFVHLLGGRFLSFTGSEAWMLWSAVERRSVDLSGSEAHEGGHRDE